jgi:hypothetical protein
MLVDGMSIWELMAAVKSSSGCYARNVINLQLPGASSGDFGHVGLGF